MVGRLRHAAWLTNRLACIFGHASYLIYLGPLISGSRDKSIKSLIQEIHLATNLGLPFLALHPGAYLGAGEASGLTQIVAGLNEVLEAIKESPVRIARRILRGRGLA